MTNADLVAKLLALPPDAEIVSSIDEANRVRTIGTVINESFGPIIRYSKKHNVICISSRIVDL